MAVATALAIGALAVGAYGAYQQSRGQREQARTAENVADFNAKIEEQAAIQADLEGRENLLRSRRNNKSILSSQRAKVAASGVLLEGSPLEVLAENAARLEQGALDHERQSRIATANAQARAQSIRMGGSAQATGLRRQATGTILGGTANLLGSGFGLTRTGAIPTG
jgi:K+-sensing histidine kinase KdpD